MKTKVVTLVSILLLSCTAAFVSCKKNDNTGDSQQQATIKFDDATYIMGQFAEWDDDGNLLFRTKGYTLNEADDTEVSLCVETWGEALSMFKEWMPEGADYTETATSLTWRMTDGFGKPQGEAVLNKVTNGTMVAEAKLPSNIPFVRTIRFIPKDKWPENKNDFVDKLYDFKKRVNLPHKIVCPKNMVKELITNMTKKAPSPIYFNEPLSMGQKQCEKFKYLKS